MVVTNIFIQQWPWQIRTELRQMNKLFLPLLLCFFKSHFLHSCRFQSKWVYLVWRQCVCACRGGREGEKRAGRWEGEAWTWREAQMEDESCDSCVEWQAQTWSDDTAWPSSMIVCTNLDCKIMDVRNMRGCERWCELIKPVFKNGTYPKSILAKIQSGLIPHQGNCYKSTFRFPWL